MLAHIERTDRGRTEAPEPGGFASSFHTPVMVAEVIEHLVTDTAGTYVDGTLGGGGHTKALLKALNPQGRVIGIDQDEEALEEAREKLSSEIAARRLIPIHANFGRLAHVLSDQNIPYVDGVLLDLGVSSHQINVPARGFSFQGEGPLDMRMDQGIGGTAADIVNTWGEDDLRMLFYERGEERHAPRIAGAIVEARPIETTTALADVIRGVVPGHKHTKTLARIFQALRIAVNREMGALEAALESLEEVLKPGGRAVVISYHSLEDRRVKRYFKYGNFENQPVRDLYGNLLTPWKNVKGPIRPTEEEVAQNPRARSARLRVAERRTEPSSSNPRHPNV